MDVSSLGNAGAVAEERPWQSPTTFQIHEIAALRSQ